MASVTSLQPNKSGRGVCSVEQLTLRVKDAPGRDVPLLVIRTRQLEQVAWKRGRRAARGIERRCLRAFVETAARTLRSQDIVAHDGDSTDFLAALVAPVRVGDAPPGSSDCRAALARLAIAMEAETGLQFETGWTTLASSSIDFDFARVVDEALTRGVRERAHLSFFATLAHELRTPLTSLRGYLETLIEDDLDSDTTGRFLETARAEALRMTRLLDGLFDVSSLEARISLEGEGAGDVQAALAAALNAVAPIAAARRTVISQFSCDVGSVLIGTDQMTQILINVLENAIKHGSEAGRVCVSVEREANGQLQICIDDNGPGVPERERSAIFALARRGSTARAAGNGLGLAVVRLLLERAGGGVDVEGSPLGGARFRLRIPIGGATC
jgi:signal transduction histidine kinase